MDVNCIADLRPTQSGRSDLTILRKIARDTAVAPMSCVRLLRDFTSL